VGDALKVASDGGRDGSNQHTTTTMNTCGGRHS
jgi:hypothetical protein